VIPSFSNRNELNRECCVEIIERMMRDKCALVKGAAVVAFNSVCGEQWSIFHSCFRSVVNSLNSFEVWTQAVSIQVLMRYARTQFKDPSSLNIKTGDSSITDSSPSLLTADSLISITQSARQSGNFFGSTVEEMEAASGGDVLDEDLKLLLDTASTLLYSLNPAVVHGVALLYFYCGIKNSPEWNAAMKALVR
jgi:AP-3 complex subunit beta